MSNYNTTLQSNNTDLQVILNTINELPSAGGSGGDTSMEDSLVTRTASAYTNDRVASIGSYAFYMCKSLTTVSFPLATTIGDSAFYGCNSLTTVSLPKATTIGSSAFYACYSLATVSLPKATTIGSSAFYNCDSLTTVSFPEATIIHCSAFYGCDCLTTVNFPKVTNIGTYVFQYCGDLTTVSLPKAKYIGAFAFFSCTRLKSLYLTGSSLCELGRTEVFNNTPIGGYLTDTSTYGSIYVLPSLLASYQAADWWSYYSSRITSVDFYFEPIKSTNFVLTNTTTNMSTTMIVKDGISVPSITVDSNNNSIASVSNVTTSNSIISFDVTTYEVEDKAIITINATDGNYSQTETFNVSVLKEIPVLTYTVEPIEGADYGFELNNNGYYESKNKGLNNTYAICKVNITVYKDNAIMYVDCINYAESNYDYGLLSNLNTTLTSSYSADSANVYKNFKGSQSAAIQTVTYNMSTGEHFIYVKFIKDSS